MAQNAQLAEMHRWSDFLKPRWLIVLAGLTVQLFVLGVALLSIGRSQSPDINLVPVAGRPGICLVIGVRPFSDAWVHDIQQGLQIRITSQKEKGTCQISTQTIQFYVVGLPAHPMDLDVLSPPADFIKIATDLILALIFSVTGIAFFLRAENRPIARVTYALFYCTALIFCLFNSGGTNNVWIDLLGFLLAMLIRGLAATFACLFPYASEVGQPRHRGRLLPYIPLITGIVLTLLSLPMPLISPRIGFVFIIITFTYNIICMVIVLGIMGWGLRHLDRQERQFVRMVVIGTIFLLFPLALGLNLIKTDRVVQQSIFRLLPIPLSVLPIACNYALFRARLLGTTSILSRQAMRILLWILLASVFVFSTVILLRAISTLGLAQEQLSYIYACLLAISLALFPFVWSKVRDVGDQVFYGDFYEYNRSLRDLSVELTRLRSIEQISAFMLPRLALLLNATETALLLRSTEVANGLPGSGTHRETVAGWFVYRHLATRNRYVSRAPGNWLVDEQLARIADLALTHIDQNSFEPILLDGMFLLALYDGNRCSGFLCLGEKFNLEPYNKQDVSFLSTLASQISVLEVNSRYLEQAQADAQQLAALNHRVISAQEEERRRLALELHDEALQQAMLVVRQLSDAGTMGEVAEVMPLARSVAASLRRTCLELRPPLLDELGLEEAFCWLAHQTEELSGYQLQIQISCSGCWETRPPADVELAFYRVGQEALSNMFKYSGANRAFIRLRRKPNGMLTLLLVDNGRGLRQKKRRAENLGLVGMHERMAAIGGHLQIRTSAGRGLAVRAACLTFVVKTDGAITNCSNERTDQEAILVIPQLAWERSRS